MNRPACAGCGSREVTRRESRSYPYPESGLDHVCLRGGVYLTSCRSCGGKFIAVEKEWQLLEFLAILLLAKPGPLRGLEMRSLRRASGLCQAELAARLGVRRESVAEREAKEDPGLSRAGEWHMRAVVLKAFREHLQGEYCNHLTPSQLEALAGIQRSLLANVDMPFDGKRRRKLDLYFRSGAWESALLPTTRTGVRKSPIRLRAVAPVRRARNSRRRLAS